jgi:hypothetical protein
VRRICVPARYNTVEPVDDTKELAVPTHPTPQTALKYEAQVTPDGRIDVAVPLPAGANVVVFVIPEATDDFADLTAASQSSTEFWDNPLDDEDWNNA